MDDLSDLEIGAWEWERFVRWFAIASLGAETYQVDLPISANHRVDFAVKLPNDRAVFVEAKAVTPVTRVRAEQIADQIAGIRHSQAGTRIRLVLATPGAMTAATLEPFQLRGIEVWDKSHFYGQLRTSSYRSVPLEIRHIAEALSTGPNPTDHAAYSDLRARLENMPCGRATAMAYQSLCGEILSSLFCPPLENPLLENRNQSGVNRRDIILPNYTSHGFWQFMRDQFRADYIVVDAKNLCGKVRKPDVLQLSNYLNRHGTGLFGLLLTRTGAERSAEVVRREQWILNQKLVLVMNDEDLVQMLFSKSRGDEPEASIRQKIENFRLSI